jgi:nitrate/TMAO reductase-like tetraheme cytochrome c subunit
VNISKYLTRRAVALAGGAIAVALVGWSFVYETVTRKVVAQDAVCAYCHLPWEYAPTVRFAATKPHKATPEGGQTTCVDCHLPKGFWNASFAYFHFVSLTDLFGHIRPVDEEHEGDYVTPRAKTAYRVRDRLTETDSGTCRTCHVESEIKPKRERGINAHKLALEQKKTCIECHYNLVHRGVDLPQAAAATTTPSQ